MYSLAFFLASLISNYESETTRWAPRLHWPDHPLFSSLYSRSQLSSKASQAVTCLDFPFFYLVPHAAPGGFFASLLLYDLAFLQFAIFRSISLLLLLLYFLRGMRYVFMIDIYISARERAKIINRDLVTLVHACMTEIQVVSQPFRISTHSYTLA